MAGSPRKLPTIASASARQRVFVVDPIDGTRAFVAGRQEWTISLAIVEAGRPIVSVLAAPALGRTFSAISGKGAWQGGAPLTPSTATELAGARFASSRRYAKAAAAKAGEDAAEVRFVPSLAYRLALVASGEVDIAIAKANAQDWDLAAADLLVEEAGARLGDLRGEKLIYNRAETGHPALVAAPAALFEDAVRLVREVEAEIALERAS